MLANKLFIAIAGVLSAGALTIGIVSAGSSGQQEDPTPTPDASPTATPMPTDAAEEPGEGTPEAEPEGADDAVEPEVAGAEDAAGTQKIAEAIAEEFETTPEEVLALHEEGIGFGALFKLYSIARAKGMTVQELLDDIESEGGGFAFGKLIKSLSEEEMEIFESGPKNLGELVSAASKGETSTSELPVELEPAGDAEQSRGQPPNAGGPPAHAKAKGRAKKN